MGSGILKNFTTSKLWEHGLVFGCMCYRRSRGLRHFIVKNHYEGLRQAAERGTPRIRLAVSLNERKFRDRQNRILVEGWRLIRDALLAKAEPVAVFYNDLKLLDKLPSNTPQRLLVHVDNESMRALSSAVKPPGIVGVFKKPRQGELSKGVSTVNNTPVLPLTVICDGLKDPSNLGSVVRTCAAAGCKALITSKGSVDVWDPKVLRCAAGGHFRIPLYHSLTWENILEYLDDNVRIFVADSNLTADCRPPKAHFSVDWTLGPSALIVGGETTGLSREVQMLALGGRGEAIRVPMIEGMDSLSAAMATTVIVYEAYRQVQTNPMK